MRLIPCFLFCCATFSMLAGTVAEDKLPPAAAGTQWRLAWSDEFDGTTIDTNKWDVMGDWKRRDGYWVKEDSYLDGQGHLVLRTKKDGERYTCGAVRTLGKFEHRFGYWVARAQLPTQPGHWPAFWLMCDGVGKIGNEGRDGTEIDIVEVPWRTGQLTFNLHWDGYGKDHRSAGTNTIRTNVLNGFHTYALLWTPEEYQFFVDDNLIWKTSAGGVSQVPEYLKLTEEIGDWGGAISKATLPDEFKVDYVRVYDLVDAQTGTQVMRPEAVQTTIREIESSGDNSKASLHVWASKKAPQKIPRNITGKFAEHLGANIYGGMYAQILRNPTLAAFPFWTGQTSPDGVATFLSDREALNREMRRQGKRLTMADSDIDRMIEDYHDALAFPWMREGKRDDITLSPDTGASGGRAQRIELKGADQGIAQWTWLPLHRVREYEISIHARSPELTTLHARLYRQSTETACTSVKLEGLTSKWGWVKGKLTVPKDEPAGALYRLALTTEARGQMVLDRVLLLPTDHVHGADPDIVKLLKESHMPVLRWPGGNFVSGYHWLDGVGPIEERPTRPNYAWGGLEPNLFGTHEFIEFCRAVGCEPMICVNGGDGSPSEAARWIEYCNGATNTPMGSLRAAHGHPEPYGIKLWEVGNELWGRWQVHWTTGEGYVDRYHQFVPAMLKADPSITLYACGAPVFWGKSWNDALIKGAPRDLHIITDHPLIGGNVSPQTDPIDVYRDFMAVPEVLEQKWAALRQDMLQGGVADPHLAVTELQLFAHIGGGKEGEPVRLTQEKLVTPATHTEALYDVLIYHAAARLGTFVDMITHSAIVNHGGGLRKERERVYANPCHYAQSLFAQFAESTPVTCQIQTPKTKTALVLPELRNVSQGLEYGVVDALAAVDPQGNLLISIVHRGAEKPLQVDIDLDGFASSGRGDMHILEAAAPWSANEMDAPERVKPTQKEVALEKNHLMCEMKPFSWHLIKLSPANASPK